MYAGASSLIVSLWQVNDRATSQVMQNLYNNFDENEKLAGVYGRQLPLSYTSDADKRDLLIAFGQDKKVQHKDYFFHNAKILQSATL